jgi:hypothetical protein
MSQPFENLPTTPLAAELLDQAFSRAARSGRAKSGTDAQQSMLLTASNILSDNLENVVTEWPDFDRLDRPLPEPIATGLLFGIRVDTKDFRREVSGEDFEAAAKLIQRADMEALQRIEDPSVSGETLDIVGRAIANRAAEGSVLLSCVGELSDRDALAQAADRLLDFDGIQATMVYGVLDGTIYVSARARGADIDLGEVLRDAFGQIGSAGGHAEMAGAQITLGVLDGIDDRETSLHSIVTSVVNDRFLDAVQSRSHRLLGRMNGRTEFVSGEYADPGRPPLDEHDTA